MVLVSLLVALSGASASVHSRGGIFAPAIAVGASHYAWLIGVGASFCFYVVGVGWVSRQGSPLLPVLVVAMVVQLAPLTGPLLLSSDAYAIGPTVGWRRSTMSIRIPFRLAASRTILRQVGVF